MKAGTGSVLTIKLGALGDFVQALGPFASIRKHHRHLRHVLLTTAPFVKLAEASGYFDEVWVDIRPKPWQAVSWLRLRHRLNAAGFCRVYDLQTSSRSSFYYRLFSRPRPEWSGIARGCSHPHDNLQRDYIHTLSRQAEQLRAAGIEDVTPPDVSWIDDEGSDFGLSSPFVLMVPAGAAHRPEKRWLPERYAELGRRLVRRGIVPAIIGTEIDRAATAAIAAECPGAVDLTGQTTLFDLVRLARRAAAAVGNDSGPMHLAAVADCPALVLFSAASDPRLCAPRGRSVNIIRRDTLDRLGVSEVEAALRLR